MMTVTRMRVSSLTLPSTAVVLTGDSLPPTSIRYDPSALANPWAETTTLGTRWSSKISKRALRATCKRSYSGYSFARLRWEVHVTAN